MSLKGFRQLDRGEVSIFAAFVLVVILAGTGLFFQSFAPGNQQSQTAAGGATSGIKTECEKGTVSKVAIVKGGTVSNLTDKPIQCWTPPDSNGKRTMISPAPADCGGNSNYVDENDCRVEACVPASLSSTGKETCQFVKDFDGTDGAQQQQYSQLLTSPSADKVVQAMAQDGNTDGLAGLKGALPPQDQAAFASAFSTPISGELKTVQAQIDQTNAQIGAIAGSCAQATLDEYNATCAPALKQQQANLDALNQQKQALADAQTALVPSTTCPTGQSGTPCAPTSPPCTTNCGSGPDNGNNKNNNTFGGSGLGSLLNGLSRGLATPPPPPAAAPAQACSTDPNAYAQQQQQYQQQLQQYNYQLQQAQYQQQMQQYYAQQQGGYGYAPPPQQALPAQPTPCSPSTQQQCTTQSPQPSPATCTSGTWQPIYSGNCIVNWQCSNLGAQLSCSPQTADVGMQLAITYSCAQGTATGTGFTTTGQSGTTTVTVAAPPAGTNTATYSLSCSSGSQTSGAQCSVQVTQPSIVLVANPATISAGQTSQLGWVTSGMQSCVISSPQDAAFTAQNASNTSVSGTATTLAATNTESYLLHCQTLAGGTKDATTTVTVQ